MGNYQSIKKVRSNNIGSFDESNNPDKIVKPIKIGTLTKSYHKNINSTDIYKQYGNSSYAYAACVAYINSIIRFNITRPPPTFKECYDIACYNRKNTGNPVESLRRLENYFKFGISYQIIKSENLSIKDVLNTSSIVCFTTSQEGWKAVADGELLECPPGKSEGWHSCVVEGYDFDKDCLICKNSWRNEKESPRFLFNPQAATDCYAILVSKTPKNNEMKRNQKENNDTNKSIQNLRHLSNLNQIAIEDLLGRETIKVNMDEIYKHIKGKRILVTGGGGSIGSELCRQIAEHDPSQLIIFDIYENNAYDIQQELILKHGKKLNLAVIIGSVRDSRRVNMVFETYKPQIVYHAAAHKHVPLMETSPCEAIKNNVIGTYKTAYSALKNGAERFILISTDKAVNPTSIMGASKRLCEMVIQTMDAVSRKNKIDILPNLNNHADLSDERKKASLFEEKLKIECVENKRRTGTQFAAVRFGNVLGSNGSVIPLFIKQIEKGGPVTVTDPEITRYFMTIPEAVSLVLQAGMYAWGGEIFVFDMGEPVKIDTLARNLIRLAGYKPDVDIKIEYIGLRPGEKLYEEKLMIEEGMKKTDNKLIHIGKPIEFDIEFFLVQLEELAKASYKNDPDIVKIVEKLVPTFHPSGDKPIGSIPIDPKS